MPPALRQPLVLTGPPAAGKSTTGQALALRRARAACIDVDDIRQLVVSGAEVPWRGAEGAAQAELGAVNACSLARNVLAAGFDVVIVDVLTPDTAATYRQHLPGVLVVRLAIDLTEAQRRAATRRRWLTEAEFTLLHRRDAADPPPVDVTIDVTTMGHPAQQASVEELWAAWP